MTFAQVVEKLLAGGAVVDIGQLTPATTRWLQRAAKAGELFEDTTYAFPRPKRRWQVEEPNLFRAYVGRQIKARRTPKE